MLYFENAQLDSSAFRWRICVFLDTGSDVKRKSGFLCDRHHYTTYGYGVEVPYFALAPNYDATFNPAHEPPGRAAGRRFRQRLWTARTRSAPTGIDQLDRSAFTGLPGIANSAAASRQGQFALNDKWVVGWDGVLLSDYYFMSTIAPSTGRSTFLSLPTEAISQLYLTGVGNRSFSTRAHLLPSFSGTRARFR